MGRGGDGEMGRGGDGEMGRQGVSSASKMLPLLKVNTLNFQFPITYLPIPLSPHLPISPLSTSLQIFHPIVELLLAVRLVIG